MSNEQVRASNPTENRNTHIVGTSSAGVRFTNLDDALLHAEALLANGYDQHGKWTLGQICDHLVKVVNFILPDRNPLHNDSRAQGDRGVA